MLQDTQASTGEMPVPASPTTNINSEEAIKEMFESWESAAREWHAIADGDHLQEADRFEELDVFGGAMYRRISEARAQTLEELYYQMLVLWEEDGPQQIAGSGEEVTRPGLRLMCNILLSLKDFTDAPEWQSLYKGQKAPCVF